MTASLSYDDYIHRVWTIVAFMPLRASARATDEFLAMKKIPRTHTGRLRILRAMRFAARRIVTYGAEELGKLPDWVDKPLERIDDLFLPEINELHHAASRSIGKAPSIVPAHVAEAASAQLKRVARPSGDY